MDIQFNVAGEGVLKMIGKRIQELRIEKGLSLSEMADRAGIAKSYLSSIERDIQGNPSIQVLEKICSVLDISAPMLLQSASDTPSDDPSPLDPEWITLVREAMASGIQKDEFRNLLEFQRWRLQQRSDE
jgi:XRE family transcriptional regulator of biofilm formation